MTTAPKHWFRGRKRLQITPVLARPAWLNILGSVRANTVCNQATFFHPDFTVGSGVSPDLPSGFATRVLVGFTTDRELSQPDH